MRTHYLKITILFAIFCLLFSSCAKEEETATEESASEEDPATDSNSDNNDDDDDGPQGYFFSIDPSDDFVASAAGRQLAQSFQVEEEITITRIALYLKQESNVEDQVYIYLGVGEEDDGSEDMPWAASIKSESGGKISSEGWYEFDLNEIGSLTFYPNRYYDIQIGYNTYPNDTKVLSWAKGKSSKSYSLGNAWTEDPAPSCGAWSAQTGYDLAMRLFSD